MLGILSCPHVLQGYLDFILPRLHPFRKLLCVYFVHFLLNAMGFHIAVLWFNLYFFCLAAWASIFLKFSSWLDSLTTVESYSSISSLLAICSFSFLSFISALNLLHSWSYWSSLWSQYLLKWRSSSLRQGSSSLDYLLCLFWVSSSCLSRKYWVPFS